MQDDSFALKHGQILCGTVSVQALDKAVEEYCRWLAQEVVETGQISTDLALAWNAPAVAGNRYAILRPPGNSKNCIRLIEVGKHPHEPAKSFGWNAFEITVRDVFALAATLDASPFEIVGPPKRVDGFTSFIPMQAYGPNGEVLFLNQVEHSDEDTDLPLASQEVGEIFIVVLASPDREASTREYRNWLRMAEGATHKLRYGLINRAFGLPMDTQQTITMVQGGRTPFLQVDQYPSAAEPRFAAANSLPMGNAMVSVLVERLPKLESGQARVGVITGEQGCVYAGRKAQIVRGVAGELLEMIEMAPADLGTI